MRYSDVNDRKGKAQAFPLLAPILLALAACGGGGGGGDSQPPVSTPPPTETVFTSGNAWSGPAPAAAEIIGSDDFRRRLAAGELSIMTTGSATTQSSARQHQFDEDRAFVEGLSERSDDLDALLGEVAAAGGLEGEREVALPNGNKVVLLDLGTRLHQAVDSYRRAHDVSLVREDYAMAYQLLPTDLQSQMKSPASLASASLAEIDAAASELNDALAQQVNLDNVHIEPEATADHALRMPQQAGSGPGNGQDNDGVCTSKGIYKSYWFPLKKFISPVKQQGKRGTCWAFTAVAAIESRERVQNDNGVDVSEQFFVYKHKLDWEPALLIDGGSSERALAAAVDHNQGLMTEAAWTYNPATNRPNNALDAGVAGTLQSYLDACKSYSGWCSESAHQSPAVCATAGTVRVCAWETIPFVGASVPASRARQVWSPDRPFLLYEYRALLAAGYSLIATFPVYDGIQTPSANGVVSNYDRNSKNINGLVVVGSSYGGHVAQIVGFIGNEDLSFAGVQSNVGGGGYFVMRNSWGCTAGDGGYFYVPADYVSSIFSSLSVLDFDGRRSSRWSAEQQLPGSADPLSIDPNGTSILDARVPANLAGKFTVKHAVANYVRLTVRSNVDGLLYEGQWLVNAPPNGALFANSLPVDFQTAGQRTLTITASYGSQVASATKTVLVLNSAPQVAVNFTGTPQQGEPFLVRAILTDINEPDPATMCAVTQWVVAAPDTIVSGEGCSRIIRFGAAGSRSLTVRTHDREGIEAARVTVFDVAPPPANPYPRITDSGVFARNSVIFNGQVSGCAFARIDTGTTIDLRDAGCALVGVPPVRYFGQVTLENPDAEALSYDWTYSMYLTEGSVTPEAQVVSHTAAPTYDFEPVRLTVGAAPIRCTLAVRVNAPEPSRSKTLTIWSGRCINLPAVIT